MEDGNPVPWIHKQSALAINSRRSKVTYVDNIIFNLMGNSSLNELENR